MILGLALLALSFAFGGSPVQDLLSGLFLSLSVAELLVGVYLIGTTLHHEKCRPDQ